MSWSDAWAFADVAARVFQAERGGSRCCRYPAVLALRALWNTGDPEISGTVAARVNSWRMKWDIDASTSPVRMNCSDKREGMAERIINRERARIAK